MIPNLNHLKSLRNDISEWSNFKGGPNYSTLPYTYIKLLLVQQSWGENYTTTLLFCVFIFIVF